MISTLSKESHTSTNSMLLKRKHCFSSLSGLRPPMLTALWQMKPMKLDLTVGFEDKFDSPDSVQRQIDDC